MCEKINKRGRVQWLPLFRTLIKSHFMFYRFIYDSLFPLFFPSLPLLSLCLLFVTFLPFYCHYLTDGKWFFFCLRSHIKVPETIDNDFGSQRYQSCCPTAAPCGQFEKEMYLANIHKTIPSNLVTEAAFVQQPPRAVHVAVRYVS